MADSGGYDLNPVTPPFIPRRGGHLVVRAMEWSRVVVLNGPRQSGKSTLLAEIARSWGGTVVTLDDRAARTDPGGFVAGLPRPLFIDEVQRGGDGLVLAVKAAVDRDPVAGMFVLAGSRSTSCWSRRTGASWPPGTPFSTASCSAARTAPNPWATA